MFRRFGANTKAHLAASLGAEVGPANGTSLSVGRQLIALPVVVNGERRICMLRQHWRRFP